MGVVGTRVCVCLSGCASRNLRGGGRVPWSGHVFFVMRDKLGAVTGDGKLRMTVYVWLATDERIDTLYDTRTRRAAGRVHHSSVGGISLSAGAARCLVRRCVATSWRVATKASH